MSIKTQEGLPKYKWIQNMLMPVSFDGASSYKMSQ